MGAFLSLAVAADGRFHIDRRLLHLGGDRACGWANLGDWSAARDYGEAAHALSLRVASAAGIGPGQTVIDAGCGWGDTAVMLCSELGARLVIALDVSPRGVHRARERAESLGLQSRICVRRASAARMLDLADASVDAVVAVDSAYHFDTRADFLAEARRVLRPGGRVAWTDLVLATAPRSRRQLRRWRRVAVMLDVPPDNVHAPDAYREQIRNAGLRLLGSQDLTREVLDGFARFSRAHARRHLWRHPARGWGKILLSGFGARLCVSSGHVGYGLFVARKPHSPEAAADAPVGSGDRAGFGKR